MWKTLSLACMLSTILALPALAMEKTVDVVGNTGQKLGTIVARQGPHGLVLTVRLAKGSLTPGLHGIHLHEHGDCSDHATFMKSKGHINPGKLAHGFLNPKGPHPADLPNLHAHQDGSVLVELFAPGVMLSGGKLALMDDDGSAIIIHAKPDDHMTQPIGGAGPRVACAVFKR